VIASEPLVAALPSSHALADRDAIGVEDLADEPFVVYASHMRSVLRDRVEEACAQQGFVPHVAMEVTETATLISFVAGGVGVSLVPASVTGMTVAGAVYRPLTGSPPRAQVAVATRTDNTSPVLARALPLVQAAAMTQGTDT
jgi:DNA-binding transcriptional LysR family regulator